MENKLIEKNLGRVSGLSSYELAVKNGTFSGTEEDYVKKEQQVYQDMLKYYYLNYNYPNNYSHFLRFHKKYQNHNFHSF